MSTHAGSQRRRSIRLRDYDYARPGAYFVTVCTFQRVCTLGDIVDGVMRPGPLGDMVADNWRGIPVHHAGVEVDAFVVMPNHLHGILLLHELPSGAPDALGDIIRAFKARVTRLAGTPVWQRNYHEHIIRDDRSLERIRQYIVDNPLQWHMDEENPLARAR